MNHEANTIEEYLDRIPADRKHAVSKLIELMRTQMPPGFQETISYKMPSFVVPHSLYAAGYHCDKSQPLPFVSLASQKNFIALYHMGLYADPTLMTWFLDEWPRHSANKPDMGKSCIRFKNPEKIPYELLAALLAKVSPQQWIETYEMAFIR